MAGDWIKMRNDLRSDPAVFKLAALTGLDRFAVVGRLAEFWGWVDKHAVDGFVDGGTSQAIDDVVVYDGFSEALVQVHWLVITESGIEIPKHELHNSDSAKERSLKNERQARWRAKKALETSSNPVDEKASTRASTREEKRREDIDTGRRSQKQDQSFSPGFTRFWEVWPKSERKDAQGKCHESWVKGKAEPHTERIIAHVERLKASTGWTKQNGEFIPAPLVYLNQRKWEGADLAEADPYGLRDAV
jgi:hypothetical protein